MEFTCTTRQSGQRLDVTVAGDIDLAIYPRFRAEAESWAGQGVAVVLDCSGVTFMDSMGLRVLVQLRQDLADAGQTLTLVNPSERVSRVLELAGVREVFVQAAGPQSADSPAA